MSKPAPARIPSARLVSSADQPQATPPPKPATDTIGTYVGLEIEARQCADVESLRFAIVNATRKLAGFDEAFLAEPGQIGNWRITLASGVHKIDRHAPLVQLMDGWLAKTEASGDGLSEAKFYNIATDADRFGLDAAALSTPHAFWLPVKGRKGEMLAALVALKREPWRPQTVSLLIPLAAAYGHAWEALAPQAPSSAKRVAKVLTRARVMWATLAALALAAMIPVPMSSLAPAEIVAREPGLVSSPIDGVIDRILVSPGSLVEKGTPILTFSDIDLRNAWELAKSRKAVAQARYFKAVQTATAAQRDVEEVAIAKAELDVAANELSYAEELLGRTTLKADRAGLLIYSSKSDWVGRPVRTGERIMEIGSPQETEIKVEVPVSDAITLAKGGAVALFLDGDPLTAVRARITRANYRPTPNGENQLVYPVHAEFIDGQPRRIGLRGVARVSANDVPLGFYLFRRPIASLRQRFGI